MRQLVLIMAAFFSFSGAYGQNPLVINYLTGNAVRDTYYPELIKLALEKTRAGYGEYRLLIASDMPHNRRVEFIQQNQQVNTFSVFGYEDGWIASKSLVPIYFPVDLGVLGWRICFTNNSSKEKLKTANQLIDFRQFVIVQGPHWPDNVILRENGFRVMELEPFSSLFKVVASGRADLFCRGINELPDEYRANNSIVNLTYDESFLFLYRMPLFFYTNTANTIAKQRIEKGLKIAYADGSMKQIWLKYYKSSIEFSKIKQRKIIRLQNSSVLTVDKEYEKYLINPLTLE